MLSEAPSANSHLARLSPPSGRVPVVLDTDTYNEIDDQFALVYALLSPEFDLQAVYAAPYYNDRSTSPADGMRKSYDEILRILAFMGRDPAMAYRGSEGYLGSLTDPIGSPAASDLIERARRQQDGQLYVLAIGAITNISSALLQAPDIAERIVVVWLGGHPPYWPDTREFNLRQDVLGAQVLFDSGVALVQIPCALVAEQLRTTVSEMETYVRGRGPVGDYLYSTYRDYVSGDRGRSKVIWDISTVGYMVNPAWVTTDLLPSPVLLPDVTWGPVDASRHRVRIARHIDRDGVFGDLFAKLDRAYGAS